MKLKRPPLLATAFTLAGACALCGLGLWQLQRLQWKEGLLANALLPPITIAGAADLKNTPDLRPVRLQGVWRGDAQILVQPVFGTGHVYTLFMLQDGTALWVNRGVIRSADYLPGTNPPPPAQPMPEGLLAQAPSVSYFKPANIPAQKLFFSVNTVQMDSLFDVHSNKDKIVYQENAEGSGLSAFRPVLANNHMGYALFWFGMAAALLGVYMARFLSVPKA